MEGKWMYNCCGSDIWQGEEFNTKEEAIEFGLKEIKECNKGILKFEVGQIEEVNMIGIDADSLFENMANTMYEEVGEVAEDYLGYVSKEHKLELEESLDKVFLEWAKKNGYKENFFKIINIETIIAK